MEVKAVLGPQTRDQYKKGVRAMNQTLSLDLGLHSVYARAFYHKILDYVYWGHSSLRLHLSLKCPQMEVDEIGILQAYIVRNN